MRPQNERERRADCDASEEALDRADCVGSPAGLLILA